MQYLARIRAKCDICSERTSSSLDAHGRCPRCVGRLARPPRGSVEIGAPTPSTLLMLLLIALSLLASGIAGVNRAQGLHRGLAPPNATAADLAKP